MMRRLDDERFDLDDRVVFLIGIGGCGMAGLARMLRSRGAAVAGSDKAPTPVTEALAGDGFEVSFDQQAGQLPEDIDLVIASAAIKPDHPELLAAQSRGIATLTYAEALGRAMLGRTAVALAGTHGKSTTTAMLGCAMTDAGLDPTVIVGATCAQLDHGALGTEIEERGRAGHAAGFRLGADAIPVGGMVGRPGLLLAEACEFNRSFHNLRPTIASIASVEADHLDIYGSLDAVVEAFHGFASLVPSAEDGGLLLIAEEGAHRREVTAGLSCDVQTIGFSPAADWVVWLDPEQRHVVLTFRRERVCEWNMQLPGAHNAMNAATAAALAISAGADADVVGRSLSAFRGVDRRTQYLGERQLPSGPVRVWDDYGHHPTEIDATLRALRDFDRPQDRDGRLVCVFQPHQHSRTRHLLDEFASAFGEADIVIVPHIYFVRDSQAEMHKVSSTDLVNRLRQRGVRAMHLEPFGAIVEQLELICRPGDTVAVMGAGPVWEIAHGFLAAGDITAAAREGSA